MKNVLLTVTVFGLLSGLCLPLTAQENRNDTGKLPSSPSQTPSSSKASTPDRTLVTPEIQNAVEKGRAFLARRQMHKGRIGTSYPVAETSLACLALMAGGNTPRRGSYRETVRKGLNYVASQARGRRIYISGPNGKSRMHGHGFALLFLSEIYGTSPAGYDLRPDQMKKKIERAIEVTQHAQTQLGGWGYYPQPSKGDEASVTITQIQALRAARNAGIHVDSTTIEQAISYVRKCHAGNGRFRYSLSRNTARYSFALTGAAVSTLNYTGFYQGRQRNKNQEEIANMISEGLSYMKDHVPSKGDRWFYYGMFYATQAFYFAGDEAWNNWYPSVARKLISHQQEDGSWRGRISNEYCTALSLLILQVPYKFLPIFQK